MSAERESLVPFSRTDALRRRISGLWVLRHAHPRFREWLRDDLRRLRGLR